MSVFEQCGLRIPEQEACKYLIGEQLFVSQSILNIRKLFKFSKPVNIIFARNIKEMSRRLECRLPSWVVAANKEYDVLLLEPVKWEEKEFTPGQLIVHEFVHIIINQKTAFKRPVWLNEGLALYFAGQSILINEGSYIVFKKNLYDMGYNDDYFYYLSGKVVCDILNVYGMENVLSRICSETDFINDNILGYDNVKKIMDEMKNINTSLKINL